MGNIATVGGILRGRKDAFTPGLYEKAYPEILAAFEVRLANDVGISLSDAPDPIAVGQNLTYTMVVTNLGRRTKLVPRWLQVVGYAAAAFLLFAPPRTFWAILLFPAWVFLLSVQILIESLRPSQG